MEQRCCVCGEPLDPDNVSRCRFCGGYFHMAWSVEATIKECGHYWANKDCCGIAFICALCEKGLPGEQD